MAGSWRILGGTSASSRLNFGKFSAEPRQVFGGPKSLKATGKAARGRPKGPQDAQKAPKTPPKGVEKRPKTTKKRGCISKPFSDVSGMTARVFYPPFWLHFGSPNRDFFMLFFSFVFGCIFGGLWLHFWCHFGWFLEVFLGIFPDLVKNGAPDESAVNSE